MYYWLKVSHPKLRIDRNGTDQQLPEGPINVCEVNKKLPF